MTAPSIDTIMDRVRKLHAKAESCAAIGSLAEAETFAAAVAKLLDTHKLSMSDVDVSGQDAADPLGESMLDYSAIATGRASTTKQKWATSLASSVARAHFCRLYTVQGDSRVRFVGRVSDREVAQHVFRTLYLAALRLSDKANREKPYADRSFRPAWLVGFTVAIAERYREQASERAGHMALVRASAEVDKYLKDTVPGLRSRAAGLRANSTAGRAAGYSAGRSASLAGQGSISGDRPGLRQLGAGR